MTFHRYYCDLKSRVAPFRTAEDFETIKTVASIDALADRADVIHRGNVPGWRFDRPEGLDEENLMQPRVSPSGSLGTRGNSPFAGNSPSPVSAWPTIPLWWKSTGCICSTTGAA